VLYSLVLYKQPEAVEAEGGRLMPVDQSSGDWDRTSDTRHMKDRATVVSACADNQVGRQHEPLTASLRVDADLSRLIVAWPTLPGHIKAAVLALLGSAGR
jgi:hypothetical protein